MVNMETDYLTNDDLVIQDNKIENSLKNTDVGYNKIKKPGKKSIEFYTSGGIGNHIRNAETGEYYVNRVGTNDELLFFSVLITNIKCNSKNGSYTLFYNSPEQYMSHFKISLNQKIIDNWYKKRNEYLLS